MSYGVAVGVGTLAAGVLLGAGAGVPGVGVVNSIVAVAAGRLGVSVTGGVGLAA